jgi:hydroxymethylpyrimidine/phosphomethylpyrimidine kinase
MNQNQNQPPVALTIAGSDSGGGAGIQADLKIFAAHGVYGTSAITALTAQNTRGVQRVDVMEPAMVAAQIEAVAEDFTIAAVKTGMLGTGAVVDRVAATIKRLSLTNLVVDPIALSSSGATLLDDAGVRALRVSLLPLARVVTPNWAEAQALTGVHVANAADAQRAASALLRLGAKAVIVTGGHGPGNDIVDVLATTDGVREFRAARVAGRSTHGTGCTFSATLAAHLALGQPLPDAIILAQGYVAKAIRLGLDLGTGPHRPMHHLAPTQ